MNSVEDALKLRDLVRRYLDARAYRNSWAGWNRLQVKGAARTQAVARADRELKAAEEAMAEFVGWTPADARAAASRRK